MPPMVKVLAVTVICRSALIVTVPAPKFRLFEPVKLKSASKANGYATVEMPAVVASIVPPAIVNVPADAPSA